MAWAPFLLLALASAAPAAEVDPRATEPDGTTQLHRAVHRDDVAQARKLLSAGAKVSAANRYGLTPLTLAAMNGNREMVELLLETGADPNTAIPGGETALMTAARTGKAGAVKALLIKGANVHAKESQRDQTAIMWAAGEGHAEVVAELVEHGADFRARLGSGFDSFLLAVRAGSIPTVDVLLKAGADINTEIKNDTGGRRNRLVKAPRMGTSALLLAVLNGHFEVAAHLLDKGADPNLASSGWTALHAISDIRKPGGGDNDPAPIGSGTMTSIEMVRKLAAKGADLNARMTQKINVGLTGLNTLGATPFLLAARSADAELMRVLAELGADPKIPNADGATPLIVAAGLGTRSPGEDAGTEAEVLEAVTVALELGNDIDAVDNNGETAMHGAAYKNYGAVVELLAAKGANINVWNKPNKHGWTPYVIALGYRFGNYKPSPPTIAAFQKVMRAAGVEPPTKIEVKGKTIY